MVYLHQNYIIMEEVNPKGVKVIHVHMLSSHKNYYFSSVRSLFSHLSPEKVGCSEEYLRHVLTKDGNHHLTKFALIVRSRLI